MQHAFVIPAYGDSPFLPACLDSIAGQSRSGSGVVIATSTPSDYLDEVARRHRVPLTVNPRRAGIGSDWNFALGAAHAAWITIAHQDDWYRPEYLERMAAALDPAPDASIAFSDFVEAGEDGPRPLNVNVRVKRLLTRRAFGRNDSIRDPQSKRRLLQWGNPVCCPSVVIHRAALADFRFSDAFESNLDWDAWLQLAGRPGAFVYVREPLVTRRIHARSETTALIGNRRRAEEDRAMFGRFWPAPVAAIITAVYRASYLANRT